MGHEGASPKKCTEMKAQCLACLPAARSRFGNGRQRRQLGWQRGERQWSDELRWNEHRWNERGRSGGAAGEGSGGSRARVAPQGRAERRRAARTLREAAGSRRGGSGGTAGGSGGSGGQRRNGVRNARPRLPRRRHRLHRGMPRARPRRQRTRVSGTTRGLSRRLHRRRRLTRDDDGAPTPRWIRRAPGGGVRRAERASVGELSDGARGGARHVVPARLHDVPLAPVGRRAHGEYSPRHFRCAAPGSNAAIPGSSAT